jgi:hypothetical protein
VSGCKGDFSVFKEVHAVEEPIIFKSTDFIAVDVAHGVPLLNLNLYCAGAASICS